MAAVRMVAGIAVLLMTACTPDLPGPVPTGSAPSATPTGSGANDERALQDVREGAISLEVPVTTAERIADGSATFVNLGSSPITLIDVDPLFAEGSATDVVVGVGILHLNSNDAEIGLGRSYPPPNAQLREVRGAVLEPVTRHGERYELVVGLNLITGSAIITGLRVTFFLDGTNYTRTFTHKVQLCTGRPAKATDC